VENAEDNQAGDLSAYAIFKFRCGDRNCGFWNTPYAIGGLNKARIETISSQVFLTWKHSDDLISKEADYPDVVLGWEFSTPGVFQMKKRNISKKLALMISLSYD
jgi:hypothetical protein